MTTATTTTARKYESSAWVYIKSEPGLWTVGFYEPSDKRKWQPESDHSSEEAAAQRVHYLNGGTTNDAEVLATLKNIATKYRSGTLPPPYPATLCQWMCEQAEAAIANAERAA